MAKKALKQRTLLSCKKEHMNEQASPLGEAFFISTFLHNTTALHRAKPFQALIHPRLEVIELSP
jgi:hypothetical protein